MAALTGSSPSMRISPQDLAERPVAEPLLIHMGDYVDRGPDSAGVIERLADGRLPNLPVINLMGNHEDLMLSAVDRPSDASVQRLADEWGRQLPA